MNKKITVITALLLALLVSPFAFAEEESKMKDVYTANAIALGKGLSSQLQMTITRWTTDEERDALLKTLVSEGQEAMIEVMKKQKETGFLRLPNTLGYRLYYAYKIQKGDKQRIVLATDRPINMVEAWRNGRSMDYAIALIQLELDENNKGEGWMGFAMQLKANQETKTLEIENYGTDPIQLLGVKKKD